MNNIPNYPSEESYSKVFWWVIRENDAIIAAKWLSAQGDFQSIFNKQTNYSAMAGSTQAQLLPMIPDFGVQTLDQLV